jgi:hypothetical protein
MIRGIAQLLIGKPWNILAIGILLGVLALVIAFTNLGANRKPRWLLIAAAAWLCYAAWEAAVLIKTPEADLRVDLLLIWPVLLGLTLWSLYRTIRG